MEEKRREEKGREGKRRGGKTRGGKRREKDRREEKGLSGLSGRKSIVTLSNRWRKRRGVREEEIEGRI